MIDIRKQKILGKNKSFILMLFKVIVKNIQFIIIISYILVEVHFWKYDF